MRVFIFIIIGSCFPSLLWAKGINEANRLYAQGKYDQAIDAYKEIIDTKGDNYSAFYGLGTALYKKEDYVESVKYLQKATGSKDKKLKESAEYNLGNALYKIGQTFKENDIDGAIAALEKSLAYYDDLIKANARNKDAKYNRNIVDKELKRLKKEQDKKKRQKKGQGENGQNDQEDKNGQSQEGKDQQGQQGSQDQDQKNKSDQENQGQDKEGKNQNKQDQKDKQSKQGEQTKEGPDEQGQGSPVENAEAVSEEQAKELLEQYERSEAPEGLLNFIPKKGREQDVDKDW